jgi:hypothetical protein
MFLVLNLVLGIAITLFQGLTLSLLFNWHAAPSLGVNDISVVQAIILMLLVNIANADIRIERKSLNTNKEVLLNNGITFCVFVIYLTVGWLLHLI